MPELVEGSHQAGLDRVPAPPLLCREQPRQGDEDGEDQHAYSDDQDRRDQRAARLHPASFGLQPLPAQLGGDQLDRHLFRVAQRGGARRRLVAVVVGDVVVVGRRRGLGGRDRGGRSSGRGGGSGRVSGLAPDHPVDAEHLVQRGLQQVGVGRFDHPTGHPGRRHGQHQRALVDPGDGGALQQDLGGPAALLHRGEDFGPDLTNVGGVQCPGGAGRWVRWVRGRWVPVAVPVVGRLVGGRLVGMRGFVRCRARGCLRRPATLSATPTSGPSVLGRAVSGRTPPPRGWRVTGRSA